MSVYSLRPTKPAGVTQKGIDFLRESLRGPAGQRFTPSKQHSRKRPA